MAEQTKQQRVDEQDQNQIFEMNAVEIARSTNAHIGIVANGKAFYFYKDMLEDMEQKAGHIIKIGHLIALCAEQGKDIGINSTRCSLSLNTLDISEEQWLSELKETDDTEYEEEDEVEEDDKEKEDNE